MHIQYEKYDTVIASSDKEEFQFESEGPKGKVKMVVQFTQTNNPAIYNLAFGVLKHNGAVDDAATNDNKDRNKILATVAATVYEFTALHPEATVFFCGSTPERTRLYRMALTINLEELKKDFRIEGVLKGLDSYEKTPFRKGVDYFGFMAKRKKM